jgi:alpha-beta hydrolase superfamily lysophospholipase
MKRLVILIAACVAFCLAGAAFITDRALHRPRTPLTPADHEQAGHLARTLGARLESVSIVARDGVTLQGWLFTPRQPAAHSVVLLHGITSNRAAMLALVGLFVEHGYRALAVDARAHGDSGGALGTFGVLEAGDLRQWIATMPDGCVYTFGQSLGAALALQAADAPGLCAVIAEAAFASLREVAFDRVGQQLGTGPWAGRTLLRPAVAFGFLSARLRYGANLDAASAVDSVVRAGVPILLIHGMEDANTPVRHARIIHAANPPRVSMWLVPGGSHESAGRAAPAEYRTRILDFLAAHRTARR